MPRDYWTCSSCGANLDHGESCDCSPVLYLCDEQDERCHRNGISCKPCQHTSDIRHAKNFDKMSPANGYAEIYDDNKLETWLTHIEEQLAEIKQYILDRT